MDEKERYFDPTPVTIETTLGELRALTMRVLFQRAPNYIRLNPSQKPTDAFNEHGDVGDEEFQLARAARVAREDQLWAEVLAEE